MEGKYVKKSHFWQGVPNPPFLLWVHTCEMGGEITNTGTLIWYG